MSELARQTGLGCFLSRCQDAVRRDDTLDTSDVCSTHHWQEAPGLGKSIQYDVERMIGMHVNEILIDNRTD